MALHTAIRMTDLGIVLMISGHASGQQDHPNEPLRIFTAGVGRGNDFLSRLIAPGLSSGLGQQIIVENRDGNVTVPGYEAGSAYGVFVPGKTPAAIVTRLNQEIVRVVGGADVKQKMFDATVEAIGSSPAEFAAILNAETARVGKVIRDAGIRAD